MSRKSIFLSNPLRNDREQISIEKRAGIELEEKLKREEQRFVEKLRENGKSVEQYLKLSQT